MDQTINNSILLMGDATSKTEKILLANYSSEKLKNDFYLSRCGLELAPF